MGKLHEISVSNSFQSKLKKTFGLQFTLKRIEDVKRVCGLLSLFLLAKFRFIEIPKTLTISKSRKPNFRKDE